MIAIITSTLKPVAHSYYSYEDRVKQTENTILKLYEAGFESVYLFDNSIFKIDLPKLFGAFKDLKIYPAPQYTFANKGLNEALLILNNIHSIPADTPIFKISGRYFPNDDFDIAYINSLLNKKEIIGVRDNSLKKDFLFNTRAYAVTNKKVLESVLVLAVEEMIAYSQGIYGLRSFYYSVKNIFKPYIGSRYQISLEMAFARILRQSDNFMLIKKINIQGLLAGTTTPIFIEE